MNSTRNSGNKRKLKLRKGWKIFAVILSCAIVIGTFSALTQPAQTLTVVCEQEEHTHSSECYDTVTTLVCGQEEVAGHTHTEGCYDEENNLICGQEESAGHTHTADCYQSEQVLSCTQEEHVHTSDCYEEENVQQDTTTVTTVSETQVEEQTFVEGEFKYEEVTVKKLVDDAYTDIDINTDTVLPTDTLEITLKNYEIPANTLTSTIKTIKHTLPESLAIVADKDVDVMSGDIVIATYTIKTDRTMEITFTDDIVNRNAVGETIQIDLVFETGINAEAISDNTLTVKLSDTQEFNLNMYTEETVVEDTVEEEQPTEEVTESDEETTDVEQAEELETIAEQPMMLFGSVNANDANDISYITNLSELVSGMSVSGATRDENGKYQVAAGDTYTVNISFAETTHKQCDMTQDLTYQLPGGFTIAENAKSGTGTISTSAGNVTFTYTIDDNGLVTIKWPSKDSMSEAEKVAFAALNQSQYAKFVLHLEGTFNSNSSDFDFNADGTGEVVFKNDSDLETSKTGYYDPVTNKIYYTVTVKSTGHNSKVVITDTISGTALKYDKNTFNAYSTKGTVGVPQHNENGFTYTLSDMSDGETVTINYAADVDLSKIKLDENGKVTNVKSETLNTVKATSEQYPDKPEHEVSGEDLTNKISYSDIAKSYTGQETDGDGNKIITWQILVNQYANVSMGGKKVTDTITTPTTLEYTGESITVLVRNKEGAVIRTDTVKLSEILSDNGNSWTYPIPDDDKGKCYSYLITYDTKVIPTASNTSVEIKNKAEDEYGESDSGITVNPGTDEIITDKPTVTKKATNIDVANSEITWNIKVDVPAEGYSEKLEVWDIYPRYELPDESSETRWRAVYDTYIDKSIEVEGLYSNESYELDTTNVNKLGIKFFYYLNGEKVYGLTSGDAARQIKISLKTDINKEYLEAAEKDENAKWHLNSVDVYADNYTLNASDRIYINPEGVSISKIAQYGVETLKINNVETPIINYEIKITGINDKSFDSDGNLVLTDTYDSTYFSWLQKHPWPYQESHNGYVYGGTIWTPYVAPTLVNDVYQGEKVMKEDTLGTLTITLNKDSIPKDNGAYYTVYTIPYYLICTDLDGLNEATSKNYAGKYTEKNTVSSKEFGEASFDVDYTVDILTKEQIGEPYLNTTTGIYEVKYKIVANPNAEQLGTENYLTLTDVLHNLNIKTDTIEVTPSGGVSWDLQSDNLAEGTNGILTFTIPNATRVEITYTANVVGTGTVNYSNNATLYGQTKESSGTKDGSSSAEGSASTYFMNIYKYEDGDLTASLEGVEFDLYVLNDGYLDDATGKNTQPSDADSWIKVNDEDKPFVTDANGKVTIDAASLATHDTDHLETGGSHTGLYRRQWYKLVEKNNPVVNGVVYEGGGTTYYFWIDDSADAKPSKGIIANGDTLTISNTPKDSTKIALQIKKTWDVESLEDIPESITFDIYQKADKYADNSTAVIYGEPITLNRKDFVDSETNEISKVWSTVIDNLPSGYAYFIKESSVPGFKVTYDENNSFGYTKTSTIGVTNKKQSITVTKKWQDENGNSIEKPDGIEGIHITLYEDGKEYENYVLTSEKNWSLTLNDLKYEGKYTVQEQAIDGYKLVGIVYKDSLGNEVDGLSAGGTIEITNKKSTETNPSYTNVSVKKKWLDSSDTEITDMSEYSNLEATVQLVRYRAEITGTRLHFMSIASWDTPYVYTEYRTEVVNPINSTVTMSYQSTTGSYNIGVAYVSNPDAPYGTKLNKIDSWNNGTNTTTYTIDTKSYSDIYLFVWHEDAANMSNLTVAEEYKGTVGESSLDESYIGSRVVLDYYDSWQASFTNLPKTEYVDGVMYQYTYAIKEVSSSSGFELVGYTVGDSTEIIKGDENSGIGTDFTVINKQKDESYELPETGGSGTNWITMSGILLMVSAIILIFKKHDLWRRLT